MVVPPYSGIASAVTDWQGLYLLSGLPAESWVDPSGALYEVGGWASGYSPYLVSGVVVHPGQTTLQDINLEYDAAISGTVSVPSLVTSAVGTILGTEVGESFGIDPGEWDTSGSYLIDFVPAPGTVVLGVNWPFCEIEEYSIEVAPGEMNVRNITLPLKPYLYGTVVDDTGQGIAEAQVNFLDQSEGTGMVVTTDDQGYYNVLGCEAGTTLALSAKAPGYSLSDEVVVLVGSGGTSVPPITLTQAATIRGSVSESGGDVIVGATVTAIQTDGQQTGFGQDNTDVAGTYAIGDLDAPGTYDVTATAFGFDPGIVSDQPLNSGDVLIVDFSLSPTS